MPKKVKGGNFKKHSGKDKYKHSGKDIHHDDRRIIGSVLLHNFSGTFQQLKSWIKSIYNGKFDAFSIKDKQTHYEIGYFNEDMKDKLLKLNGAQYGQSMVYFTANESDKPAAPVATPSQIINEIIQENFNKETNYVDLSNISDKLVQKNYHKHVDLMFHSKIIQQLKDKYPNTAGIGYNNNELQSLSIFKEIERALPQLVALNLMNNNIKDVQQLEFIKNIPLEVLSLNNNKILEQREFELKIVTYFHNLVLLNQQPYTGQQYFPVTSRQKVPPLKIALTTEYTLYKIVLKFLEDYYQSIDNQNDKFLQCYTPISILSLTVNGSSTFINSFVHDNRNHAQTIAKNEYLSRLYVGPQAISKILPGKFKQVGHGMRRMAFDISMWTVDGQTVLNVVAFGQLKHPRETINFHTTFLILFDQNNLQLKQILNQHIHLFQKRDNFSVVQPSVDARQSIEKLEALSRQQNLNMGVIVFPLAKNSNFDFDLTVRKLSVMAEIMGTANQNNKPINFNQVHAICELYSYDKNMMAADCNGQRFKGNFAEFIEACLQMCQEKGMIQN